jgi:hypothetical protein
MNKNYKLILFSLFLICIQSVFGSEKVRISPIDTIATRFVADDGIIFHVDKIKIAFSIDQVVSILDSLVKKVDINSGDSDYYDLCLKLDRQIRTAKQFDIVYDDMEVYNSKSLDSRLDSMDIALLHNLCTELIDSGSCRILDNGKAQYCIIKSNVYVKSKYSSTTYVKYYLKGKKYLWTGLPIIQDDFE